MKTNKEHPWGKSNAHDLPSSANAITHGCTATQTRLLPTETSQQFHALEALWFKSYAPTEEAEKHLIHQLVDADWLLQRSNRAFAEAEAQTYTETPNPIEWSELQHQTLARFLRYRTTHTNTVAKARKAVEDYRRNRTLEQARLQATHHKEEKLVIAQAKLEIYKHKNKPELTWDQHLEGMRQQAIDLGLHRSSTTT